MPSNREAQSPSWRAMVLALDDVRSAAAWLTRRGRATEAELCLATVAEAIRAAGSGPVREWREYKQARAQARSSAAGRARR